MRHPFRNLLFAGTIFAVSGSLLSTSTAPNSAQAVQAALQRDIEPGVTLVNQVIRCFGEPAVREQRRGPGQTEVFGYNHEVIAPQRFPLLPLLSFPRRDPADTFFEITDGVVTRCWTEM